MIYTVTDNYPLGSIAFAVEDLHELQDKGWEVNMHTPYYANFIGVNLNGLKIGFCNYMDSLETLLETPEVGYYSDSWQGDVQINSQQELDWFIAMIDNAAKLKNTKTNSKGE
jgi:hypothetical protein